MNLCPTLFWMPLSNEDTTLFSCHLIPSSPYLFFSVSPDLRLSVAPHPYFFSPHLSSFAFRLRVPPSLVSSYFLALHRADLKIAGSK